MAAVGEQRQRAARGADPLEHLDRARLRVGPAVVAAVGERAVDVEHEPANLIQAQAVKHGAAGTARTVKHGVKPWVASLGQLEIGEAGAGQLLEQGDQRGCARGGRRARAGPAPGLDHRVDLLFGHGQAQQQLLLGDAPAEPLSRAVEADRLEVAQLGGLRAREHASRRSPGRPARPSSP